MITKVLQLKNKAFIFFASRVSEIANAIWNKSKSPSDNNMLLQTLISIWDHLVVIHDKPVMLLFEPHSSLSFVPAFPVVKVMWAAALGDLNVSQF